MSEDLNKRHKAALDVALMDLDVAAIPTKSDVFVRCGTGARDLHDAITDLRQRLQAAEERAEKAEEDLAVIHRAAAHCCGRFGGRMSEVDRIFQEITRVSSMHETRAALKTEEA